MFTTRTMIVLSAIAATGFVALTAPSQSGQTVGVEAVKMQDRHPAMSASADLRGALQAERGGMLSIPVSTPKTDRLDLGERDCTDFTWPNVPAACLTKVDDVVAERDVRTVSIIEDENNSFVSKTTTVLAQH